MTGRERIERAAKENGRISQPVPYTRGTVAYSLGGRRLEIIYTPTGRVGCVIGGGLTFAFDNRRKADQVVAYFQRRTDLDGKTVAGLTVR